MLLFPNCKINIGLRIVAKRADGFHDLETIFFPIPWYDVLEIMEAAELRMHLTGQEIPGDAGNNLCIKAWHLLKKDFPDLPAVDIYLHKTIPTGAGLGGGSSNGTFMLRLLNEKFDLGATNDQLKTYALQLGSDCPFFIINKPALATGRGEKMTPIDLDLAGHHIVLVNPGIHVSTGWAFSQIAPAPHQIPLSDIVHHPMSEWEARGMINDLEAPVLEKYPEIRHIKESLYQKGASFAAMSGSGSTVFGIFSQLPDHSPNEYPSNYLVKILSF